ncbi:MAG TPA: EAL domain-containing protein [Steroidobacteraceae bacterium]|nr:EAL domain-containing protein [Steroidobacteraceae bacterium]
MIPTDGASVATVLVVDDNATNRQLVSTLLKYQGHVIHEAADGLEALRVAELVNPSLVISDILMPTMDGFEFIRLLRSNPRLRNTEVIFYTAHYHEREAQALAEQCQVARVLTKPCEPADILNAVDQVLNRRGRVAPTNAGDEGFGRQHLELITNKLAQKADELHATNARLQDLTELNLQLASERDPHALLRKVCYGARQLLGATYAILTVYEKRHGTEVFVTVSGIEESTCPVLPPPPRADTGPLGRVFATGIAWRAHAPRGDASPVLPSNYPTAGAYLAVPISSLDHIYGWLCLVGKVGAEEFARDDERVLSILGAQVGRIYENGSLYHEIQLHAAHLQLEIEERERATSDLLRSEERFRQLAGHIHDVFFVSSLDGDPIYVSPAYERIWGRPVDLKKRSAWLEAVHPEDLAELQEKLTSAAATPVDMELEYRVVRPDGGIRYVFTRYYPVRDEQGNPYRVVGISTDVTERRHAEKRIRHLNRVYAVLSGINGLIVRAETHAELFSESCRLAVEDGDFRFAWIGSYKSGNRRLTPAATSGDDFMANRLGAAFGSPQAQRFLEQAAKLETPYVCNDLTLGDELVPYVEDMAAQGYRSFAALPLAFQERTMGCMLLATNEVHSFDAAEMRLLEELAGDIAFAIDHIEKAEQLDYLAYYDALTGLANRKLLVERLSQRVNLSNASDNQFAVMVLDPERLDSLMDTFGRTHGDALLKELGNRLAGAVGNVSAVARIGSSQFAAIIPFAGDANVLAQLYDSLYRDWLGQPFRIGDDEIDIVAQSGVALFPHDASDPEALLQNAEAALKRARSTGERLIFFTPQISQRIAERRSLEARLRRALENREFVLYYQPKVDLEERKLQGVEALIRWKSPELGLVPPMKFIPLMEENGMIVEVGAWALRQAALEREAWLAMGLNAPRVAVNVSTVQLRRPDFVAVLTEAIAPQAGRAPGERGDAGIDIEVTESLLVEAVEETIGKLRAIRTLGVGIAIDDFGTGYSSLSYLTRLPVQSVKIDRSFTISMLDDPSAMTLVSTMITLAHALKLSVIAEGAETEEQAKILRLLRCDQMQGYLIDKPMPVEALIERLRGGR